MKTSGKNLVEVLKNGGVAVMPTDTIYGIVGKAENAETVERIYKIRKLMPILATKNLEKHFDGVHAVDHLSY